MKRVLVFLFSAMLVVGLAGQAMAFFTIGDFQLAAYEGSLFDTDGYAAHFDLGIGQDTATGRSAINTGINLGDFDTNTWGDVSLAIFGGAYTSDFQDAPQYMTVSKEIDSYTQMSVSQYSAYQSSVFFVSYEGAMGIDGSDQKVVLPKAGNPFTTFMLDTYSGTFFTDVVLTLADNAVSDLGFFIYEGDSYGMDQASYRQIGTFTIDTTGTDLLVSYNPGAAVPVPGAVILLGSGLLGLAGIRSRFRNRG